MVVYNINMANVKGAGFMVSLQNSENLKLNFVEISGFHLSTLAGKYTQIFFKLIDMPLKSHDFAVRVEIHDFDHNLTFIR